MACAVRLLGSSPPALLTRLGTRHAARALKGVGSRRPLPRAQQGMCQGSVLVSPLTGRAGRRAHYEPPGGAHHEAHHAKPDAAGFVY